MAARGIRSAGIVFVGLALALTGCGGSDSGASAEQTAADEEQVRAVLQEKGDAFTAWDTDRVAELTCAKYREDSRSLDELVPPMDMFPADESAALGPQGLADLLAEQFTGATPESLLAVSTAVVDQNEPAYHDAMLDVVKQIYSLKLDKIDNIEVDGDTATADTTLTQTMGAQPPQTQTTKVTLVREDGEWKDCTPPATA